MKKFRMILAVAVIMIFMNTIAFAASSDSNVTLTFTTRTSLSSGHFLKQNSNCYATLAGVTGASSDINLEVQSRSVSEEYKSTGTVLKADSDDELHLIYKDVKDGRKLKGYCFYLKVTMANYPRNPSTTFTATYTP